MKYSYTFNLKEPTSKSETLIYFRARFKNEDKYMKYSTGEKINPKFWDKNTSMPLSIGNKSKEAISNRQITNQLLRYGEEFSRICSSMEYMDLEITTDVVKKEFDKIFKKDSSSKTTFYNVLEKYIEEKRKLGEWSEASFKKYNTIKILLEEFQEAKKYNLSFNTINNRFYVDFVGYCREVKKHKDNTLGRYLGFFKTFMRWANENKYHNNNAYEKFEKMSSETYEIALTDQELQSLKEFDFSNNKRLEKVRDVFVFGCATGLRYSEYSKINKKYIRDNSIHITSKKQKDNLIIPLNTISKEILEKYNFELPMISEQKFREYIKEACELVGFTEEIIKTSYIGSKRIDEPLKKYKLISSHTARRTFITLSLEKGMRPEVVMSITGHKDYRSFKKYIKLSQRVKNDEMQNAWK